MDDLRRLLPATLAARARHLQTLTGELYRILPQTLVPHCEVIGFEDGILTLAVDSAVWRTRLRFVEHDIRRRWPAAQGRVEQVRIRVVEQSRDAVRTRQASPMPAEAAARIEASSHHVADSELAAALRRLSRRGRRRD